MPSNELYLTVLPLIHLGNGLTEQSLTVFPDRNFATEFFRLCTRICRDPHFRRLSEGR